MRYSAAERQAGTLRAAGNLDRGTQKAAQKPNGESMGKTIKVCVRTRPTAQFAAGHIAIDADRNAITIDKGHEASPDGVCNNAQSRFDFRFHHVLHNASQDTVYETLARDVVQDVVDGINGTIMTYGQTGSGKTFTMLGDMNNYVHRGVAPRALAHVFADVAARIETQYTVVCTYMEIYNERIFDLLKALGDEDARNDYQIVEEKGGRGVFVRGLTEVEVASEAEALNLLYSGQLARTTAQHKLNRNSNRSHSIFTVTLRQQSRSGVSEKVVTSKLNLVDLAGSERLKKTMEGADGTAYDVDATMKKESMYINQSLTYLEQCVVGLSKRAPQHVAYRQTKLTGVLKDSLGGNCATLLFACMWAESAHLEETVSTLRLAQRMMRVQNTAEKVQTTDPARLARKQERLIRDLRQELLMHDALADRSGVKYDPYTPEEQAIIAAQCRRYADADEARAADLLEFDSVRQMREMCAQFKKLLRDAEAKAVRARTAMTSAGGVPTGLFAGDEPPPIGAPCAAGASLVRVRPARRSFLQRPPPRSARPRRSRGRARFHAGAESPSVDAFSAELAGSPLSKMGDGDIVNDRSRAFEHYKRQAGRATHEKLQRAKRARSDAKSQIRDAAARADAAKRDIADVDERLEETRRRRREKIRAAGRDDDDVVDDEEFVLMRAGRDAKRDYRDAHGAWLAARRDHAAAALDVDATKAQLVDDFQQFFAQLQRRAGLAEEAGPGDKLDDQEAFDKLEMERVAAQDPDALAFFRAQKTRRATATQNRSHLRQLHRNKRT
ncbi:unnamed protein product [Pelagomonas calceolata]|uniref:Kinesin-like protein n=2 Tax=Pelagomonas calceolata TaxID=35677 RepID=A0A8J2X378_9STRA|nr:unnamed protein product [Pelagomonas calceolata]